MSQVLGASQESRDSEVAARSGRSILQVENLRVSFKKSAGVLGRGTSLVRAVDNVSFNLDEGEIFSLVGESGSGKTTIAKCLMKLTEPESGTIKFDSRDVTKIRGRKMMREYRENVQMVYQDPFESLNPRWDVFTTIAIPIRLLSRAKETSALRERVTKLIEEVGLTPFEVMNKYPHQLSGGERQRVNIARALACDPKLLVADEPVTMLDASQRLNILSLLTKLKKDRNLTILLITHDLASAKLMSNRAAIMFRGRIVELGKTSIVLSRPNHPYTKLILETIPRKGKTLKRFSADYASAATEEVTSGCSFRLRCKYASDVCTESEPLLEEKSPGHLAACHHSKIVEQATIT